MCRQSKPPLFSCCTGASLQWCQWSEEFGSLRAWRHHAMQSPARLKHLLGGSLSSYGDDKPWRQQWLPPLGEGCLLPLTQGIWLEVCWALAEYWPHRKRFTGCLRFTSALTDWVKAAAHWCESCGAGFMVTAQWILWCRGAPGWALMGKGPWEAQGNWSVPNHTAQGS